MNKSAIFTQAHKLAKAAHVAGDCYRVTFAAALRIVIAESKAPKANPLKAAISISRYKNNLLVKVPFGIKDEFKKVVRAKWAAETKEWVVSANQEAILKQWLAA